MAKREHESDAEYKERKKAKKLKKKEDLNQEPKNEETNNKDGNGIHNKKKKKKKDKDSSSSPTSEPEPEAEPTTTYHHSVTEFQSFAEAPFDPPIQQALRDANFTKPSPIQSKAWPMILQGKDVVAVAKTGSGKTLGFLLPVFHQIVHNGDPMDKKTTNPKVLARPMCVILSPTRELALQIHKECVKFGTCLQIRSTCIYGGTKVSGQIRELQKIDPHIVIATPGRLCDLLQNHATTALSLDQSRFCILDESDRMLDMGFEQQLQQIMDAVPMERQTLLFTATWPKSVQSVARKFLREQETRELFINDDNDDDDGKGTSNGELAANKAVTQVFVQAQDDEKDKKLYDILCDLPENTVVLVFTNTKRRADYVNKLFWQEGFATCAVHGDKKQNERDLALRLFVKGERNILFATDVAARGLDIPSITHVINFDMARDVETYVHRIGRTGRAGQVGTSITFWNPDYDKPCAPALIQIAQRAGQDVPDFLQRYERTKPNKQWTVSKAEKVRLEV